MKSLDNEPVAHEETELPNIRELCRPPTGRIGKVVMKFNELPPNCTEDQCIESKVYPHMEFPFKYFNPMQSSYLSEVGKDNNVVVCGRTSAGKTVVAELTFAQTLEKLRKTDPQATVAYISPLKALAAEKEKDWKDEGHFFHKYNISILTGDYILTDERKKELAEADIVCMSSEMLGSRIRRNKTEKNEWINNIRAVIIDESHLLTVAGRGPNLEVALMKFTKVNPKCRIIFLSATMPNVDELGGWLTKLNGRETTIVKSDYRPVDLKWNFEIFQSNEYYYKNEQSKVRKVLAILHYYKKDKFIVFVHSKKIGRTILDLCAESGISAKFHNADLNRGDRESIEASFKSQESGSLRVLVSTSTLAWGLNMPARRVLIAGLHRGMNLVEPLDIIQMGGRAGRVGLDTQGDVHVLIRSDYEKQDTEFCTIIQPITSQIANLNALAFHMVSEIAEGNVTTYKEALQWYLRSLAYHQDLFSKFDGVTRKSAQDLIKDVLERLVMCGALTYDKIRFYSTAIGKVASWFYFSPFDTAAWVDNFKKILTNPNPSDSDIAWAIGNSFTAKRDYPLKLIGATKKMYATLNNHSEMIGGVEKHTFAMYCLLTNTDPKRADLNGLITGYRIDSERMAQAIDMLGNYGKYFDNLNAENIILELPFRIRYGCGNRGIELLMLPGVGKKTVGQIMNRKIFSCKELVSAQELGHKVFTDSKWEKVKTVAKEVARTGHIAYLKKLKAIKKAKR